MDLSQYLCGTPARSYIFQDETYGGQIRSAARALSEAEAVLIGAGAGLSTAAGLTYSGKRFTENFGEFIKKYGKEAMCDMYAAGFYPFPTEEEKWGYWSKHSMVNRILPPALPLYQSLFELIKTKDYFVVTTNVDHQFWKAGFEDGRIFAPQGDYGLIQCGRRCHNNVYDAAGLFCQMDEARKNCRIPFGMVPKCPVCGGPMEMNLLKDENFAEDGHWHDAARNYGKYLESHRGKKLVMLELGVGFNTPAIIRFPFEKYLGENRGWILIRLNLAEAVVPKDFNGRSVGINADLNESLEDILKAVKKLSKGRDD